MPRWLALMAKVFARNGSRQADIAAPSWRWPALRFVSAVVGTFVLLSVSSWPKAQLGQLGGATPTPVAQPVRSSAHDRVPSVMPATTIDELQHLAGFPLLEPQRLAPGCTTLQRAHYLPMQRTAVADYGCVAIAQRPGTQLEPPGATYGQAFQVTTRNGPAWYFAASVFVAARPPLPVDVPREKLYDGLPIANQVGRPEVSSLTFVRDGRIVRLVSSPADPTTTTPSWLTSDELIAIADALVPHRGGR